MQCYNGSYVNDVKIKVDAFLKETIIYEARVRQKLRTCKNHRQAELQN